MALSPEDFKDLIETIRSTSASAEQKKVAAATITLRMLRSQALGNGGDMTIFTNGSFRVIAAGVQDSITNF